MSLDWEAPPYAGAYYYYYGVCDSDPYPPNCFIGVRVIVEGSEGGSPDLVALPPHVTFSINGPVENIGSGPAASTEMYVYRSDDPTIEATESAPVGDILDFLQKGTA